MAKIFIPISLSEENVNIHSAAIPFLPHSGQKHFSNSRIFVMLQNIRWGMG